MRTVADILLTKGNPPTATIHPGHTVLEAITLMAEKGIGALVVVDDGEVAGIVSERDYARKVVLMERSSYNTAVRDIMTAHVITVQPTDRIEHCMALMTERRLRHLPVIDGGQLVGMVSIGDLVKEIIAEQARTIGQLESYIRGQ